MRLWKTPKGTELVISDLRGKDYLEIKYRIVWFREDHPNWTIETEIVDRTATSCLSRASIKDDTGRLIAQAHKFEDKQGFGDFIEKSETSAIGRALALIGYGTQFCADDLDEGERLADSPTDRRSAHSVTEHTKLASQILGAKPAVQAHQQDLLPMCCGKPMNVSKFNENELYCYTCKKKAPRAA